MSRRLRLMRRALTAATSKYGIGGRLKSRPRPPITLAGAQMGKTFTTIYVVMRFGVPVGAYTDKGEAMAHSRAIGGPGEGHSVGFVSLELVHGPRPDADQQDQPGERADSASKRR